MLIEELIFQALTGIEELSTMLAKYNHNPAIFYRQAPLDSDSLWGEEKYPRVVYNIDFKYDAQAEVTGTVNIMISCLPNKDIVPENIELCIRLNISELFLTQSNVTYATLWKGNEVINRSKEEQTLTLGLAMKLDISSFPKQYETYPSPVEGVNMWIKECIPSAKVIGVDTFTSLCRATNTEPIIYCRLLINESASPYSNCVTWITANIAIHVFANGIKDSQEKSLKITNALSIDGEIMLTAGNKVILKQVILNTSQNPLQRGQITVVGEYGVIRQPEIDTVINHVYTN